MPRPARRLTPLARSWASCGCWPTGWVSRASPWACAGTSRKASPVSFHRAEPSFSAQTYNHRSPRTDRSRFVRTVNELSTGGETMITRTKQTTLAAIMGLGVMGLACGTNEANVELVTPDGLPLRTAEEQQVADEMERNTLAEI